jgi:hypothetical protein
VAIESGNNDAALEILNKDGVNPEHISRKIGGYDSVKDAVDLHRWQVIKILASKYDMGQELPAMVEETTKVPMQNNDAQLLTQSTQTVAAERRQAEKDSKMI